MLLSFVLMVDFQFEIIIELLIYLRMFIKGILLLFILLTRTKIKLIHMQTPNSTNPENAAREIMNMSFLKSRGIIIN